MGIVSFQVNDKIEKSNYYQFTVNPIEPLPGGNISSSDNIVYNYTSSIPTQTITDVLLSGSLTQAKEITSRAGQLAISGAYSNWDIVLKSNNLLNEQSGSTIFGKMNAGGLLNTVNYGYYPPASLGVMPYIIGIIYSPIILY